MQTWGAQATLRHSGKKTGTETAGTYIFFIIILCVHSVIHVYHMGGCCVCPQWRGIMWKGVLQIRNMFYMSTQGKSVTVLRGKIWGVVRHPADWG